jgi:RNA-binding protein NOB1
MNLNLVSTDGMRVKRIKNWVMRCHACYHVTSDMDKKFCPKCGNSSLMRTSCSTDQYGNVTYWMKKNFQYNLRGTKVSLAQYDRE